MNDTSRGVAELVATRHRQMNAAGTLADRRCDV